MNLENITIMSKEIIELIDFELEKSGRSYMGVAKANKIVNQAGLNTENNPKIIQMLIKEGKIPHAFKFPKSPQWSIPLSEAGKKRQEAIKQEKLKKENQRKTRQTLRQQHQFTTICPRCRTNLVVPHAIVNQYYIQCNNCSKNFKNPFVKQKKQVEYKFPKRDGEKEKKDEYRGFYILAGIVLIFFISIVIYYANGGPKNSGRSKNNSSWQDPGMNKNNTGQLIKELRNTYEDRAVTSATEQSLYNKVGGMYPGDLKGPQFYKYDFLEVSISMTLLNENGRLYYMSFQRGGVRKGDPRLNLPQ